MLSFIACPDLSGKSRLSRQSRGFAGRYFIYWKYCLILVSIILFSIQIYAQSGAWTKKADLPKGGGSASVVDGKIYVFGGSIFPSITDVAYNVVYDPLTNTWEEKASMPTARGFLTTAVMNDTIYAIGGGYPTSTNKNEAYDPATNSWTTKANMLGNRLGMHSTVVDGIIYIFGGNYNQHNCQAYNPNTNIWEEKAPIPDGAGGGVSVTAYNGLIYIFGGSTYSPWAPLSKVYVYNPQTDAYTPKKDMPTARFKLQTYLVGEKIYAIGGSQSENTSVSTVEVYDPVTDTWETKPNMPHNRAWFTGAVVNDKIYVIGGTPNWSTPDYSVWEYDPDRNVPVELSSFTATANGKNVTLNWSTASEINNYGFEIQRSKNENEFFTIGFVDGYGTTTEQQNYVFTDNNLNKGKYYYRLKQIDYDGRYEYSDVVEVEWRSFDSYLLEQNYPNPFNPATNIGFGIRENSNVRLSVFNSIGEEIVVLVNGEIEQGFHQVEFNAANLPSGVYFYQLKAGDFVATKKLLLLK